MARRCARPLLASNFLSRVRRLGWRIVAAVVGRCSANQRAAAGRTAAAPASSGPAAPTASATAASAHSVSGRCPSEHRGDKHNSNENLRHMLLRVWLALFEWAAMQNRGDDKRR
jgi:hypothetical protein